MLEDAPDLSVIHLFTVGDVDAQGPTPFMKTHESFLGMHPYKLKPIK